MKTIIQEEVKMPNSNYCPSCGAPLIPGNNVCPQCGKVVGPEPVQQPVYQQQYYQPLPAKSKVAAGILFLLLGDIGVGNFYMGKIGLGVVDLLFCWTGIPGIVNFIRGIIVLCSSDESFCQKYNCRLG